MNTIFRWNQDSTHYPDVPAEAKRTHRTRNGEHADSVKSQEQMTYPLYVT